jgi:hypothetical protein
MTSRTILCNKVLSKNSTKETRGLKLAREREEELGEDEWTMLCFGGENDPELRKKIYGKETKKIVLRISY